MPARAIRSPLSAPGRRQRRTGFQPSNPQGTKTMRHQKAGRKFNRTSAHRQAMLSNMAASLFKHELIKTTLPMAKELRRVAEPLITLDKTDSVANRRLAFSRLRDKVAVGNLFTTLGPRCANRPGGYLRIHKCGFRAGDNAPMAYVELVDRPRNDACSAATRSARKPRPRPGLLSFGRWPRRVGGGDGLARRRRRPCGAGRRAMMPLPT